MSKLGLDWPSWVQDAIVLPDVPQSLLDYRGYQVISFDNGSCAYVVYLPEPELAAFSFDTCLGAPQGTRWYVCTDEVSPGMLEKLAYFYEVDIIQDFFTPADRLKFQAFVRKIVSKHAQTSAPVTGFLSRSQLNIEQTLQRFTLFAELAADYLFVFHFDENDDGHIESIGIDEKTFVASASPLTRVYELPQFIHPDDLEHSLRNYGLLKETGEALDFTFRARLPGDTPGVWRTLHVVVRRETVKPNGKIATAIGILRDITEQCQLIDAYKASESRLRVFLELTEDLFFIVDSEGRIDYANPRAQDFLQRMPHVPASVTELPIRILGYTLQQIRQRCLALKHLEVLKVDELIYSPTPLEIYYFTGDVVAYYDITLSHTINYYVFIRDVTEMRKQAKQVQSLRNQVELLLDNFGDSFGAFDKAFRVLFFNRAFRNRCVSRYGIEPELGQVYDILFKHPDSPLAKPEDSWRFIAYITRVFNGETIVREFFTPSPRPAWFELTLNPIRDTLGRIIGFTVLHKEITDRKLADERVRRTKANLSALIDNRSDPIWSVDLESIPQYYNKAYVKLYSWYTEGRLVLVNAMKSSNATTPENSSTVTPGFNDLFAIEYQKALKGFSLKKEIVFTSTDSRQRYIFNFSLHPILSQHQVIGVSIIGRDVTQERLQQADLLLKNTVFDIALEPVFIIEDWKFLGCNDAALRMLELNSLQELQLETALSLSPEYQPNGELSRTLLIGYMKRCQVEPIIQYEWQHLLRSGRLIFCEVSVKRVAFEDRILYVCVYRDITERKRALEELSRSQALLHSLINNTQDSILVLKPEYEFVLANQMMYLDFQTHWSIEPQPGDRLTEVLKPQPRSLALLKKPLDRAFEGERVLVETREKVAGRVYDYETSINPIVQDGRIESVSLFIRDISLRKQQEAELHKKSEVYQTSRDSIWIVKDGVIIDCNAASVDLFSCNSPSDLIGLRPIDFWATDPNPRSPLNPQASLLPVDWVESHLPFVVWKYRRLDGSEFIAEVSFSTFRFEDEWFQTVIHRDLTERLRVQEALVASERKLSTVVTAIQDAIWSMDTDGVLNQYNLVFVEWFTELVGLVPPPSGKPILAYCREAGYSAAVKPWLRAMLLARKTGTNHFELSWRRPNGQLRWVETSMVPLRNAHSGIIGYVGTSRDITERKALEQAQREEAENILKAVLHGQDQERKRMAEELHDGLAQYVHAARLNVERLKLKSKAWPDDDRAALDLIDHILYDTILEIRTISHNLSPRMLEDFGLVDALRALCQRLNTSHKSLKADYYTDAQGLSFETTIETSLYRIAQEALTNVQKHAKATHVYIQLTWHDGWLVLTIEDNGVGLKGRDSQLASGIGLRNIKTRIELLGGTLTIDSQPNEGTSLMVEVEAQPTNQKHSAD
jgi:PAS domain S-box-containing protein